jgi:hypothetical protein
MKDELVSGGGRRVGPTTAFVGAALTRLPSKTVLRSASSVVESCEKLLSSGSAFMLTEPLFTMGYSQLPGSCSLG